MNIRFLVIIISVLCNSLATMGQSKTSESNGQMKKYFIDVHQFQPGTVDAKAVAHAHEKDLAVEGRYGVQFLNYWVSKEKGLVFCLSTASDSASIRKTHAEAHGLLPYRVFEVSEGQAA